MKLINKILPILDTSAIVLTIPAVASCSSNTKNNIDLDYLPSVKQHDTAEYSSNDEVLKEYSTKVKENTQILIQDYIWSRVQQINNWLKTSTYSNKSATTFAGANISIETKTLSSKYYYVISGDFAWDFHVKYAYSESIESKDAKVKIDSQYTVNYSVQNLYLSITKDSEGSWILSTNTDNSFDWQIIMGVTSDTYYDIEYNGETKSYSDSSSSSYVYDKFATWTSAPSISFASYYLKNVKIK